MFTLVGVLITPESLGPVILQRKAMKLRRTSGNWALHSKRDEEPVAISAMMQKYGLKPMKMLMQEPILIVMTIYISLCYGR